MCKEAAVKAEIQNIKRRIDKLEAKIDGDSSGKGLSQRLARLERAQDTQTWLLRMIIGGVVANFLGVASVVIKTFIH